MRPELNRVGAGMAVHRPQQQRTKDQEIESPLKQLDFLFLSRVDIQGERSAAPVECQREQTTWESPLPQPALSTTPANPPSRGNEQLRAAVGRCATAGARYAV